MQKTKIMVSGPITSWQIEGGNRETVTDFLDLGTKVTADGDCSHEIKRHLLLGRNATTNLDSILESRDINLPTNVCLVKAIVFPWSCMDVSWIIKKRKNCSLLWDSVIPWPTRFLWGKSTGVSLYFLLQRFFWTWGSNPGLLHCRQTLEPLSHKGKPKKAERQRLDAFEL